MKRYALAMLTVLIFSSGTIVSDTSSAQTSATAVSACDFGQIPDPAGIVLTSEGLVTTLALNWAAKDRYTGCSYHFFCYLPDSGRSCFSVKNETIPGETSIVCVGPQDQNVAPGRNVECGGAPIEVLKNYQFKTLLVLPLQ